jgi:hypothetical protein
MAGPNFICLRLMNRRAAFRSVVASSTFAPRMAEKSVPPKTQFAPCLEKVTVIAIEPESNSSVIFLWCGAK